jgi:hypothetical protein
MTIRTLRLVRLATLAAIVILVFGIVLLEFAPGIRELAQPTLDEIASLPELQ